MREYGYGYTLLLAAVIFASPSVAQSGKKETQLDTGRASARQRPGLASPRIGPTSPAFENERSCTYRGGPKTGFWSCQ